MQDEQVKMVPDAKLLQETLAYIEQHPERWEQREYLTEIELTGDATVPEGWCGTAGCFAGTVVLRAGYVPFGQALAGASLTNRIHFRFGLPVKSVRCTALCVHKDEENPEASFFTVAGLARRMLGLTDAQADILFDAANTLDDLRRIVGRLVQISKPESAQ